MELIRPRPLLYWRLVPYSTISPSYYEFALGWGPGPSMSPNWTERGTESERRLMFGDLTTIRRCGGVWKLYTCTSKIMPSYWKTSYSIRPLWSDSDTPFATWSSAYRTCPSIPSSENVFSYTLRAFQPSGLIRPDSGRLSNGKLGIENQEDGVSPLIEFAARWRSRGGVKLKEGFPSPFKADTPFLKVKIIFEGIMSCRRRLGSIEAARGRNLFEVIRTSSQKKLHRGVDSKQIIETSTGAMEQDWVFEGRGTPCRIRLWSNIRGNQLQPLIRSHKSSPHIISYLLLPLLPVRCSNVIAEDLNSGADGTTISLPVPPQCGLINPSMNNFPKENKFSAASVCNYLSQGGLKFCFPFRRIDVAGELLIVVTGSGIPETQKGLWPLTIGYSYPPPTKTDSLMRSSERYKTVWFRQRRNPHQCILPYLARFIDWRFQAWRVHVITTGFLIIWISHVPFRKRASSLKLSVSAFGAGYLGLSKPQISAGIKDLRTGRFEDNANTFRPELSLTTSRSFPAEALVVKLLAQFSGSSHPPGQLGVKQLSFRSRPTEFSYSSAIFTYSKDIELLLVRLPGTYIRFK
ncbi:uncharacterized protein BDR25DRAFT_353101 [Lindgomyces ingoldianus]|uniref:Uncharacterized protein n=1 Tax=Lindgomyces ingoldianus TaxID=673940 RepID=A0ACB6R377_9PLEO|nr:uncharacterized protein BDR25DRAFT_353101 [Lindgomyces ingoldianus]KAF2472777.1 hypothetical protein BDR25DRAFT_353101 [Lindgomyces ingoldianus]